MKVQQYTWLVKLISKFYEKAIRYIFIFYNKYFSLILAF